MADAPIAKPDRSLAIDAVKGVGILQVVLHHTLGQSATLYAERGDPSWLFMRGLAWSTNFAIPLFLLVTAMLLTLSLRKRPPLGEFVWRRASRTLWPYLLWTVVYWLLRARNQRALLHDYPRLAFELMLGKAGIHLYFMVILLQFTLVVPLVYLVLRERRVGFGPVLLASIAIQEVCFLLQKHVLKSSFPADYVTWYVSPLMLGVWIALNRDEWNAVWRRWWPAMAAVAVASAALFAWMSVGLDLKQDWLARALGASARVWESPVYNWTCTVFRTSASLALLGAAGGLAATFAGPTLAAFGRYSLPIYLVHPVILKFLGSARLQTSFAALPMPALWTLAILLALSYGFAWAMARLRLDLILFGQSLPAPLCPPGERGAGSLPLSGGGGQGGGH